MERGFLILFVICSAYGKLIPVIDDVLPENNLIIKVDVKVGDETTTPVNVKNEEATTKQTKAVDDTGSENELDSVIGFSNNTLDLSEEFVPTEPPVKVDNGTALILTPMIKEGRIAEARNACRVDPELFLGFESYSGFFTVNETYNSNLFFWYFPNVDKPLNDTPVIVWLQGGPGASSLTGLFDEIGPVTYSPYTNTLKKNPHTWLQNHSLIFIDNPVGTGYSFTMSEEGFVGDINTYGSHMHSAMMQLIQIFPELRTAPLYVAGESYAGKYVPALTMEIHKHINRPGGNFNLQGMMIGNAYVDPEVISNIAEPFQYFGLLDQAQINKVKVLNDGFRDDIKNNKSVEAKSKWNILVSSLLFLANQRHGYNFLRDSMPVGKFAQFLKRSDVKRAIHVGDIHFSFLNVTVNIKMSPDFLSNTKPYFEELLNHYRVLAYCGQLDQMLPCLYTSKNYATWRWNQSEEFNTAVRYPYLFNDKNSGYFKSGGGLTEVVFRGAGHMVPMDTPAPAQVLVARWTHRQPPGPMSPVYEGTFLDNYIRRINVTSVDVINM